MIQASFPKVADQVVTFNKNIIDILSKINSLTTTTESSVDVQIFDEEGILRSFTLPSFTSLKAEIDRLNNNINSLYSIDADGSLIQTSNSNKFKKIITVDLNREPLPVSSLGVVSDFKSKVNWFFDSLVDPMLQVEIDLSGKVENNVRKCLVRRYIIEFATDANGNLTNAGQSALNSFNELWRGNANIIFAEFDDWHKTTNGLIEPLNPKYDEDVFDLEPNNLLYDGEFSVLRIQEDRINKKLWYVLNTLDYIFVESSEVRQLSIGDELIVNSEKTSTRYRIIEVSLAESNPRVRLERIEGIEPIPVGIGTLKIYSPIIYTNKVRVSIGYNERNIVFLKPINTDNNLVSKKWSFGTGYYSNDLRLQSSTPENGLTMEQFYSEYVYDYGAALKDMVAKKIPNKLAGVPNIPNLNSGTFKVVQINKHLTDTPDLNTIKQKHNQQLSLKSEVKQIEDAIIDRNKNLKVTKFKSKSDKNQYSLEIDDLIRKKDSRSKLLSSVSQEIIELSKSPIVKVEPKFRLRGFWPIPESIVTRGTLPQEVIQFKVQYRYVSADGREVPVEQFEIDDVDSSEKAVFSNWTEFKSDVRKRIFDAESGEYFWELEDVESADTPNINQIDIPIQKGERVEFRVKSISEVGWPESPVESEWSEILSIDFPDDLNNIVNESDFILQDANKEDILNSLNTELESKGLTDHLSDTLVINNKVFHHDASKISSGIKDENGVMLDLFEYLRSLEDKVRSLEERISRARGILSVIILKNNEEFIVENGSETTFNVECEDYLTPFSGPGVPSGRVYENSIYVIKDFVVKVTNIATGSNLGLLSGRNYLQNSVAFNPNAPQSFWVNDQDELLKSDVTAQTRTQLNNQFIWSVNYDSVSQRSISRLSENTGNQFIQRATNSITNVLSSPQYNIGYNETSILNFVGNNTSLLDPSKWIDTNISVASTNKLLTTIHPVIKDLETLVENNTDKVKSIKPGDNNSIIIPINIYFKMNSLDTNQNGLNYQYIDMNKSIITDKHVKKVKFMLENESDNRPFEFTIKFNINRNKVIQKKIQPINVSVVQAPTTGSSVVSLPSIVRGGGRFQFLENPFGNFNNFGGFGGFGGFR
jgi:hypothetical protein